MQGNGASYQCQRLGSNSSGALASAGTIIATEWALFEMIFDPTQTSAWQNFGVKSGANHGIESRNAGNSTTSDNITLTIGRLFA